MSSALPLEAFCSVLDDALADRERRRLVAARAAIHARALAAALRGPVTAVRRDALVRAARRAGLDDFEARLLISGAEYRAGVRVTPTGTVLRLVRPD